MSDRPVAKASTYTTNTTEKHQCPQGIQTRNPSNRAAIDPRLRLQGYRD